MQILDEFFGSPRATPNPGRPLTGVRACNSAVVWTHGGLFEEGRRSLWTPEKGKVGVREQTLDYEIPMLFCVCENVL